jgi:superfamily I DNA/RNA helicase
MMTVHASKGLEFKNVFIVGVEEEIFPHMLSIQEDNVEEERRLFYVAITRAIKRLFVSHSNMRNIFGRNKVQLPSRFLDELPADVLQQEDGGSQWL